MKWLKALQKVMKTFIDNMPGTREQDELNYIPYTFSRVSNQPTESLQSGRLAVRELPTTYRLRLRLSGIHLSVGKGCAYLVRCNVREWHIDLVSSG